MERKGHTTSRKRVAIAGVTGSIGSALSRALADEYDVVAVTHLEPQPRNSALDLPVTWRKGDFFSRSEMSDALAGADYGLYLVHTRLPTARLDQAQCEDMELIIADNFARAARTQGLKQLVCIRGLRPRGEAPPELLRRQSEVVEILGGYGVPVTVIRAGLVVAPGSTLINLIANQVRRGRFVPVPRWALRRQQPVAVQDVIRAVAHCLGRPDEFAGSFDIGGPEIVTWRDILGEAAELLGKTPRFVMLQRLPRRVYRCWLRRRSPGTHSAAVRLLVEDLQVDSVPQDNPLQQFVINGALDCREAIRPYLSPDGRSRRPSPRSLIMDGYRQQLREGRGVRSIQRVAVPQGRDAEWMATAYFRWLERFVWPAVTCGRDDSGSYRIQLRGLGLTLLELTRQPERSDADRCMYFITGGVLVSGRRNVRGRMEFRSVLSGRTVVVAIHEFAPALPWNFYQATQAKVHGFVMRAFQRYMARQAIETGA